MNRRLIIAHKSGALTGKPNEQQNTTLLYANDYLRDGLIYFTYGQHGRYI